MRELQLFAGVVHGFLAFGHLLGILYNAKRKHKLNVVIHSAALAFDVHSIRKHYKAVRRLK